MSAKFPRGGGANPFSAIRLFCLCAILGNPGVIHYVPTAFMNAVGTEWITPGSPRVPLCISAANALVGLSSFASSSEPWLITKFSAISTKTACADPYIHLIL